jgi:hypothetical protein
VIPEFLFPDRGSIPATGLSSGRPTGATRLTKLQKGSSYSANSASFGSGAGPPCATACIGGSHQRCAEQVKQAPRVAEWRSEVSWPKPDMADVHAHFEQGAHEPASILPHTGLQDAIIRMSDWAKTAGIDPQADAQLAAEQAADAKRLADYAALPANRRAAMEAAMAKLNQRDSD